jgi:hypothetical protein
MDTKAWYASKTVWFNVIATVLDILSLTQFGDVIPHAWAPYIALAQGAGNIVLRRLSSGAIAFTAAGRGLVILLLASASLTACGGNASPALTPEQAQQARLRDLARVATVTQRVGTLVESLQTAEIAFHQAGRVTREDHRVIQLSLKITADTVLQALEQLKDFTQPEVNRRQWIAAAIVAVQRLIGDGLRPILDDGARMELQLLASSITAILISLELTVSVTPAPTPQPLSRPLAPHPFAGVDRPAIAITWKGGLLCA